MRPHDPPGSGRAVLSVERLAGARIVNARGVPGTLGLVAIVPHEGTVVLVSSHHVVFGAGASAAEPIWLIETIGADQHVFRRLGRSVYGKQGTVPYRLLSYHVDCAIATLEWSGLLAPRARVGSDPAAGIAEPPLPGMVVTKTGAVTGTTKGVIVDVAYRGEVSTGGGRVRAAVRQILVRSVEEGEAFSAEGDSGAVLADASGGAVGLLWGANHRGEGIACHIRPVLKELGVLPLPVDPPSISVAAEGAASDAGI